MDGTAILSARQVSKRVTDGRTRREILRAVTLDLFAGELLLNALRFARDHNGAPPERAAELLGVGLP